jgi:hypothetical protein
VPIDEQYLTNFNSNLTMARAMFDYTKAVLSKVSFDVNLFCKELKKALTRLLPYEIEELKIWIDSLLKQNPQLNHV